MNTSNDQQAAAPEATPGGQTPAAEQQPSPNGGSGLPGNENRPTAETSHTNPRPPGTFQEASELARSDPELAELLRKYYQKKAGLTGKAPAAKKVRWTVAELRATVFPEPNWLVPGLIPEGLVIFGGRPKAGKSRLAMQIAHAKGSGGSFFGRQVPQGKVLYLALEDTPRRLKDIIFKQDIPSEADITFYTEWASLAEGGLNDLQVEITAGEQAGGYRLVVIDTFSRAAGRYDQLDLCVMGDLMGQFQRMTQANNLVILLLDHHRKNTGFSGNPIDDVMGSTGKSASADAVLGMYREYGKHEAELKIVGREIADTELALRWDKPRECWQLMEGGGQVRAGSLKSRVLAAVMKLVERDEAPTNSAIAAEAGADKGNTSRCLAELVAEGKLLRDGRLYLPVEQLKMD